MDNERGNREPYIAGFDQVRREELADIKDRWKRHGFPEVDGNDLQGLALSGGGIRSASFALGVIQQLGRAGQMSGIHYLSTVSGGGYAGSALTWLLSREHDPGERCFGTTSEEFPLLGGAPAAARRSDRMNVDSQPDRAGPAGGRSIIDFIRQRSSYLVPGAGLGLLSAVGVVLRSVVISLLAYFLLFTLAGLALQWGDVASWNYRSIPMAFVSAAALLGLLLASAPIYSLISPLPGRTMLTFGYRVRRGYQVLAGKTLGLATGLVLFGLWLLTVTNWAQLRPLLLDLPLPAAAATATAGGALGGVAVRALAQAAPRLLTRLLLPLLPPLALFLLVAGLGAAGYVTADYVVKNDIPIWAVVAASMVYLAYANINLTGLHRFYRDRLMEVFLPDLEDVQADLPSTETSADNAVLHRMFAPQHQGPYHLINTNVVLLGGRYARYRSRRSDSFVLSPGYCGSEATGWARTSSWLAERRTGVIRPVGPITLPTAMAISAAAVNPNTGADGKGATRSASVSALLTILNIRLGYWVSSPRRLASKGGRSLSYPPNFLVPGLTQGIFGLGRDERADWLELTDGGHFDNTGLYELVRRRVRTIYLVDGSEDPNTSFASFANAAEKIYIDFNVQLDFDKELSFVELMRGADTAANPLAKAFQLANKGFAVARLSYPSIKDETGEEIEPKLDGWLYYIKSTLTKDLPAALYSYRADNPSYPAESTADQFFSEQQFEAYRALGFSLAMQLTAHLAEREASESAKKAGSSESAGP